MKVIRKYRFILLPLGAGLIIVLTTSLFAFPRFNPDGYQLYDNSGNWIGLGHSSAGLGCVVFRC